MNIKTKILAIALSISVPTLANASPFTNPKRWGDMFMVMPTIYGIGMGVVLDDYDGMFELGGSLIAAQLATEGIKGIVKEKRPNGSDHKSFPSGHAAGAFSGAMYVHKRYGWKPAVLPYAFSVITGYSRVYARAHYWHDILGGAAVSALFTVLLINDYSDDVQISAAPGELGLRFNHKF